MDKLCDNAKIYAQILKNCSLPQVGDWDLDDVTRGFQWARYFTSVKNRINHKPVVVKKFDSKIREIGRDLGVRFGGEELSYEFLTDSLEYFIKCLLDNPALSEELQEVVLNYTPIAEEHLSKAANDKLLLTSLKHISSRLLECVGENSQQDLNSLDAEFLKDDLTWLLKEGKSDTGRWKVEERLSSLAQIEGGMKVIFQCLLQDDRSTMSAAVESDPNSLDPARRAILEWLVGAASCWIEGRREDERLDHEAGMDMGEVEGILDALWQHSNRKMLAQVSLRYLDFSKVHVQFLAGKTRGLERRWLQEAHMEMMELEEQDEVCSEGDTPTATPLQEEIEWVGAEWVELARSGHRLRETCISLLKEQASPVENHPNELATTHSGHKASVWSVILDRVIAACNSS